MKTEERVRVEENAEAHHWSLPFCYNVAQIRNTRDVVSYDLIFDQRGFYAARVHWTADVSHKERLKIMRALVDLYNLRYGVGL